MNPEEKIETQLEQLAQAVPSGDSFVHDVMSRIETSSDKLPKQSIHIHFVRRLFMKRTMKFAAAAIVLIAALLSLTLLDKTVTPAYAIEQTIEANRSLRFIHLKCDPAGEGVEEIWARFDENGQLQNLRMNFPNTDDGPKDVVWQEGKAEVWFKKKNSVTVVVEEAMLARLKMSYADFDPKLIVKYLYRSQGSEKVQIEIQDSRSKDQPIIITSTTNGFRDVFKVNPETLLLEQIEKFALKEGQYVSLGSIKYLDYNQPAAADVFVLNPPADAMRVDQTTQVVGLEQGQMTNDQAAVEVVRRFWQAIIEDDYQTAGQMMEGIPAEALKKIFAENFKAKVVKIVSVGPVKPHPNPATKGVVVPCTLEIEIDGQTTQQTFDRIGVRQVYNQPGRWTIFGGI
ncbi:MAG: hypothetical protein ABFD91_14485 [Anaerohalosphaeraceae bacterium]